MNKKLLAGLMSVVMLAGSGATVGAEEVGKSKVSNNSVVRFVKNHKKIIVGMLVVGAGAGVGYYKREEVKNGFNTAKDKIKNMTLGLLKKELNAVKINSRIESKPVGRIEAEEKEKVESVKSVTGSETGVATKTSQDEIEAVKQRDELVEMKAEAKTEAKTESEVEAEEKEEVKKQHTEESPKSISSHNVSSAKPKPKTNSTYVLGGNGGIAWTTLPKM